MHDIAWQRVAEKEQEHNKIKKKKRGESKEKGWMLSALWTHTQKEKHSCRTFYGHLLPSSMQVMPSDHTSTFPSYWPSSMARITSGAILHWGHNKAAQQLPALFSLILDQHRTPPQGSLSSPNIYIVELQIKLKLPARLVTFMGNRRKVFICVSVGKGNN